MRGGPQSKNYSIFFEGNFSFFLTEHGGVDFGYAQVCDPGPITVFPAFRLLRINWNTVLAVALNIVQFVKSAGIVTFEMI